jgi:phage-related protein
MAFYGSSFVWRGIPSESFNIFIMSPDGGESITQGSPELELITQKIPRRSRPYLLGIEENTVLSFNLSVYSPDEISAVDAGIIQRYLFGHRGYGDLIIIQEDLMDSYFRCVLTEPKIRRVGNLIVGFDAVAVCDSPYAWSFTKNLEYTYTDDNVIDNIRFVNQSDSNDYLYPKIIFTMNSFGGDFSIYNAQEERSFEFTGLSANETIEIDNDLKTIKSSKSLRRLEKFNKKWFRFVPGLNRLWISGNVASVKFVYQFARKIGG